jgi:hypothetical protein
MRRRSRYGGSTQAESAVTDLEIAMGYFDQLPGESREDFVRRFSTRPGVVADGVTLVDLYNRIAALERRVAQLEGRSTTP